MVRNNYVYNPREDTYTLIVFVKGGMKEYVIDSDVFPYASELRWSPNTKGYLRNSSNRGGKHRETLLHRVIIGAKRGELVDHIDRDVKNNRIGNLRKCNSSGNTRNRGVVGSVKYKGVCYDKYCSKYKACIKVNYISENLGYYSTAEEAALAYDKKAMIVFGEFAYLNFPETLN